MQGPLIHITGKRVKNGDKLPHLVTLTFNRHLWNVRTYQYRKYYRKLSSSLYYTSLLCTTSDPLSPPPKNEKTKTEEKISSNYPCKSRFFIFKIICCFNFQWFQRTTKNCAFFNFQSMYLKFSLRKTVQSKLVFVETQNCHFAFVSYRSPAVFSIQMQNAKPSTTLVEEIFFYFSHHYNFGKGSNNFVVKILNLYIILLCNQLSFNRLFVPHQFYNCKC